VLVTGASGFIGRHTLPLLAEYGYEVHAVFNSNRPISDSKYNWHKASILESVDIENILCEVKPEYLLHLAWETEHGKFWNSQENYKWVSASLNLVEKFKMYGGKRLVAAGSCAEYEPQSDNYNEELTPINPSSVYGKCKYEFYSQLRSYARNNDLSFAWGRIFYLYGQNENANRLVPLVIRSLLLNQMTKTSHGNQVRDYLHVEDVASAFVKILDSELTGAINIASGISLTLNELTKTIAAKIGKEDLLQIGALPVKENEPAFIVADVSRLKNELFWQPKYNMSSGLDKTIDWWNQKLFKVSR
jgi:nucleoside-diphosphate-sugar epimerase